jgi:hypothetical protein
MWIGIVGSEAAKFTPETEARARAVIRRYLSKPGRTGVISGGCHLGGIDEWAIEEGRKFDLATQEFKPQTLNWSTGYKPRNLKIAQESDAVLCITVKELPPGYQGMRFKLCYHCGTDDHVKSGGCWTMKQAARMGKPTHLEIIV